MARGEGGFEVKLVNGVEGIVVGEKVGVGCEYKEDEEENS